jgi:hypothetical protein
MKRIRIFSFALITGALFLTSCDDDNEASTTEKLQQYWAVDSVAIKTTTVAGSATIIYNGSASDYYDFKTNDSLYYKLNTEEDVLPYSILSDSWLLVDGDSTQILSLSGSKLQLYRKDVTTSTDYVETTAWLRR